MKTNREHFSWSQYDLWHRSKREYWKRYHIGAEEKSNRFFDKGKELATFIETGEILGKDEDPMLEQVVKQMPRLAIPEDELRFNIVGANGKEVLCFTDSSSEGHEQFLEYKTGKIPWTQERVDDHEQLPFYALGYWKKYNIIPNAQLVWVETMDTKADGLLYTGTVKTFNRDFTELELLKLEDKIRATIIEIEEFDYQELEVDNKDAERYAYLLKVVEEANQEMSAIKMKVHAEMLEQDVTFGKADVGNFIITKRKSWKYSEVVDELKKDITKQQKHEQKMGVATFTESESIMFKLNK